MTKRRKGPRSDEDDEERVDPEDLLRQLNSKSHGGEDAMWDEDGEEGGPRTRGGGASDWGTEDIEAFARARMEEEGLELDEGEDGDGPASGSYSGSGGSRRVAAWAPAVPKGAGVLRGDPSIIVMDAAFARRNGAVVAALQAQGRRVLVDDGPQQGAEDDAAEVEEEQGQQTEEQHGPAGGSRRRLREVDDEFEPPAPVGGPRGGRRQGLLGEDAPPVASSSSTWFEQLESAGFSVRGGSDGGKGGVFLERRTRVPARGQAQGQQQGQVPAQGQGQGQGQGQTLGQEQAETQGQGQGQAVGNRASRRAAARALKEAAEQGRGKEGAGEGGRQESEAAKPAEQGNALEGRRSVPGAEQQQPSTSVTAVQGLQDIAAPVDDLAMLDSLKRTLYTLETTEQVLDVMTLLFPYWAGNGCHLVHPATAKQVASPSPALAARALHVLASFSRSQKLPTSQRIGLSSDTRVLGLVECLRVAPPRLIPDQVKDSQLQMRLSEAARGYWLAEDAVKAGGGSGSIGDPMPAPGSSSSSSSSTGRDGPEDAASSSGAGAGDGYSQLLAKYTSGAAGLQRQRQQQQRHQGDAGPGAGSASSSASPQQLQHARMEGFATAIWALAVLGGPALFMPEMEALMRVARLDSWRIPEGELADVAWALGHARHWTPRLEELEACICRAGGGGGLSRFMPAESSRILWAFATLGHTPSRLLQGLTPAWSWQLAAKRKVPKAFKTRGDITAYTPSQLSSALRSLAVLGQVNTAPFVRAWQEAKARGHAAWAAQGDVALTQIWQAALALKLEGRQQQQQQGPDSSAAAGGNGAPSTGQGGGDVGSDGAPSRLLFQPWTRQQAQGDLLGLEEEKDPDMKKLLHEARASFLRQTTALRKKVHSSYQRSIANTLTGMRTMHLLEDNSGGYSVDVSLPGSKIAIEADGPTHLARTDSRRMLGASAMKRRHLQLMGWHVINVSFQEWDNLSSADKRQAFLKQAISDALDEKLNL